LATDEYGASYFYLKNRQLPTTEIRMPLPFANHHLANDDLDEQF
jgi:hypothetical protein